MTLTPRLVTSECEPSTKKCPVNFIRPLSLQGGRKMKRMLPQVAGSAMVMLEMTLTELSD